MLSKVKLVLKSLVPKPDNFSVSAILCKKDPKLSKPKVPFGGARHHGACGAFKVGAKDVASFLGLYRLVRHIIRNISSIILEYHIHYCELLAIMAVIIVISTIYRILP